ncbi:MAG: hypothetical protein ACLQF2_18885, partial [Rhodomicrobium sp.]
LRPHPRRGFLLQAAAVIPGPVDCFAEGPLTPALSREGRGGHRGECEGVPSPLAGEGWGEGAFCEAIDRTRYHRGGLK